MIGCQNDDMIKVNTDHFRDTIVAKVFALMPTPI